MKPRKPYPRYWPATGPAAEETPAAGTAPELLAPPGGPAEGAPGARNLVPGDAQDGHPAGPPHPDGAGRS